MLNVLLALAAVMIVGRALAWAFAWVRQPPVIGEVVAGILLGPSLLGWLWPDAMNFLLPQSVLPHLGVIAQLGVILYMFLVGLELNPGQLRGEAHRTAFISTASIVVPFVLGTLLTPLLYPPLAGPDVGVTSFALFLGLAMSITAFPVLARILTDRGMSQTPLGVMALLCAAINDGTAWCLLALVVGVAKAEVGGALLVIGLSFGFLVVMIGVARPLLVRLARRCEDRPITQGVIAVTLGGLLLSSLTTEAIGLHALFGAFLYGALVPHDSQLARTLHRKLHDPITVLLLPAFFAFTGMRTQIGLVSGWDNWLLCGLIVLVATVGKFGGTLIAARLTKQSWRDSASLGVLMNMRGLMELIVLNVGYDLGVISPTLFAMMVLMALATTFMTSPLLSWLRPRERGATLSGEPFSATLPPGNMTSQLVGVSPKPPPTGPTGDQHEP